MEIFLHPETGDVMTGMRLVRGAILRPGDAYDSTSGRWTPCPSPGLQLGATKTLWVRPIIGLLPDERDLLTKLVTWRAHAAQRRSSRGWYIIPTRGYASSWNHALQPPFVDHPECLQSLTDVGLLYLEDGVYSPTAFGVEFAKDLPQEH